MNDSTSSGVVVVVVSFIVESRSKLLLLLLLWESALCCCADHPYRGSVTMTAKVNTRYAEECSTRRGDTTSLR